MIGLFFPSHVNLADIKGLFPDKYEYHRVLLFLHKLISLYRIQEIYSDNRLDEGYVFIHSDKIRMILGNGYTSILEKMSQMIDCIPYYVPKIQSRQYRIKEYKGFTIIKLNNIPQRAITIHDKLRNQNLDKKRFPIRYKVSEITKSIRLKNCTYSDNGKIFEFLGGYTSSNDFLYAFNNNLIYDKVDYFGSRLYTKITNLKKELRKDIYFIGCPKEPVCEIDFSNSQFYFLAYSGTLASIYYPEFKFINEIYDKYELNSDFNYFKHVCSNGLFYEVFITGFKDKYSLDISRDVIKELMYILVYGDLNIWRWKYDIEKDRLTEKLSRGNKSNKVLALYGLILEAFPSFISLMIDLKSTKWDCNHSKKGMKTNNCFLAQRIESSVVFDSIANRLLKNGITKFTTVHDSFVCLEKDKQKILYIIDEVFFELGIPTPKLR